MTKKKASNDEALSALSMRSGAPITDEILSKDSLVSCALCPTPRFIVPDAVASACLAVGIIMPFPGHRLFLGLGLFVLVLCVLSNRDLLSRVHFSFTLLFFLTWITVSVLWSQDPASSIAALGKAYLFAALALLMAADRTFDGMIEVFATACKWLICASWFAYFAVPGIGRSQEAYESGALQGLFIHRNGLGFFGSMALATLIAAAFLASPPRRRAAWLWVLAGALTGIASMSRTSWGVMLASSSLILVIWGVRSLRGRHGAIAGGAVLTATGAAVYLATSFDSLVAFSGRDATFTGRTAIWKAVESAISREPWLGYGYSALWQDSPVTQRLWADAGFHFFTAHNGFLDISLQVGVIGLGLALCQLINGAVAGVRAWRASDSVATAWTLGLVLVFTIQNLTEAVAFDGASWALLTALPLLVATRREPPP